MQSRRVRQDRRRAIASSGPPPPEPVSSEGAGERPTQVIYRQRRPVLVTRRVVVRVVSGPDKGKSSPLELQRLRVGSAPDSDLVLGDARVSRAHLEFQVQDSGYLVQDLGSTNGTFYRGARIKEALLAVGAELQLGATVLRIEEGPERSEVIDGREGFGELIGVSPAMRQVFGLLDRVAPSDVSVLIEGETGTGKEIVAEELHRHSPRSRGPLVVLDCGAIPASLIESDLFGHERGAFTGASGERQGAFERARGGSIFLDEIGELPLELQTRLLRVLDKRTIRRVGSDFDRKVDVRVIAATNRGLEKAVQEGRFRQDLYFRLAVVRIIVPPLRERREDIPVLARHFLWQAGCADPDEVLKPDLLRVLTTRSWPGNVRELRNLAERAVVVGVGVRDGMAADGGPADDLPPASGDSASSSDDTDLSWLIRAMPTPFLDLPLKVAKERLTSRFESVYLERLLQRHGANISRIAQDAGIDRHMVRILLRKLGLDEKR